jgi:alpha-beta hydrolase superfamily lysophospholipase
MVDGFQLHTVSWLPVGMKAMVLLVHGLGEYALRYRPWIHNFYAHKIGFLAFDMRGHGYNAGKKGRFNYNDGLKDIDFLVRYMQEKYPFIPKLIYGNSMGGSFVLRYAIDYKPLVAGLIVTSPWIKLANPPSENLISIIRILHKFIPFLTVSNQLKPEDLSPDQNVVYNYAHDPLVHDRISPGLFLSIKESGEYILVNKHKINIPLLLMHGGNDNITSCAASSDFANLTGEYTTLRIWKNAYHELHHEIDKADIFNYVLQWIEQQPSIQPR